MSTESQNLLASFDALPIADQKFVAAQIAQRFQGEDAYFQDAVQETSTGTLSQKEIEVRLKRFHEWASKRKPRNPNVDDSRESIYEGCGE